MIRGIRITSVLECGGACQAAREKLLGAAHIQDEHIIVVPNHPHNPNPIPRKITLVTVCTAFSNCISESG